MLNSVIKALTTAVRRAPVACKPSVLPI